MIDCLQILVATFYVAVLVPYNAAFGRGTEASSPSVPDVVVEMLFIIGKSISLSFEEMLTVTKSRLLLGAIMSKINELSRTGIWKELQRLLKLSTKKLGLVYLS